MKSKLHSLPLVLGFAVFIILTFTLSWKYFKNQGEQNVAQTNVSDFPVVILTPDKAEIIILDSLKDFETKNPNYSFLVPNGKEQSINQQLANFQDEQYHKGIPTIKVERISTEKQVIQLEIQSDGFVISKYEANEKEVKPLTLNLAGPGFIIFPCGATFFAGIFGFALLRFTIWFLKKRKTYL